MRPVMISTWRSWASSSARLGLVGPGLVVAPCAISLMLPAGWFPSPACMYP